MVVDTGIPILNTKKKEIFQIQQRKKKVVKIMDVLRTLVLALFMISDCFSFPSPNDPVEALLCNFTNMDMYNDRINVKGKKK